MLNFIKKLFTSKSNSFLKYKNEYPIEVDYISDLKKRFDDNDIIDITEIPEQPEKTGVQLIDNLMFAYHQAHFFRGMNAYGAMTHIDNEYNLNLKPSEALYQKVNGELLEKKTVKTNITYHGLRWNYGLFRTGTLSYSREVVKEFKSIDFGDIFITNHRIIFIGNENQTTKSITYSSILSTIVYQDAILLLLANRSNILFKFYEVDIYKSYVFRDDINMFKIAVSRIMNKDYYTKEEFEAENKKLLNNND